MKMFNFLITVCLFIIFWTFFGSHLYMIGVVTAGVVLGNWIYHKVLN